MDQDGAKRFNQITNSRFPMFESKATILNVSSDTPTD